MEHKINLAQWRESIDYLIRRLDDCLKQLTNPNSRIQSKKRIKLRREALSFITQLNVKLRKATAGGHRINIKKLEKHINQSRAKLNNLPHLLHKGGEKLNGPNAWCSRTLSRKHEPPVKVRITGLYRNPR